MYIAKVTTYKRGRNVQVAKRPGGETSCEGAKRPGGETSKGRNVHKPNAVRMNCLKCCVISCITLYEFERKFNQ